MRVFSRWGEDLTGKCHRPFVLGDGRRPVRKDPLNGFLVEPNLAPDAKVRKTSLLRLLLQPGGGQVESPRKDDG